MDANSFAAKKLKELRIKKNLTQEELAEELGITQQQVARYENNKRQFKQDFLFKLADYFKISINEFFPKINEFMTFDAKMAADKKGITHKQLAKQCQISEKELEDILNGTNVIPDPAIVIKLAETLDEDPFDFLESIGYLRIPFIGDDPACHRDGYKYKIRYLLNEKQIETLITFTKQYALDNDWDINMLLEETGLLDLANNINKDVRILNNDIIDISDLKESDKEQIKYMIDLMRKNNN